MAFTYTRLRNYESVCHRRTSRRKCMSVECTQNMSRKKIFYKFTQFLQGISIFIFVKFTLTDEYSLQYVCAKFELYKQYR